MAFDGFVSDYQYPDDGFRFSFEDMEHLGYKAYWVSLKLRTDFQKNVFRYIYDHPGCVAGDIMEAIEIKKDALMHILRGFNERELLKIAGESPRHYSVNKALIDELLNDYKRRVFKMFPDVKERCEKREILEKAKDELIALNELLIEEREQEKAEKERKAQEAKQKEEERKKKRKK